MTGSGLHILAIEPDPGCREELRRLLVERFPADSITSVGPESAEQALRNSSPALVLISALAPAATEEIVLRRLNASDPEGSIPVLTVPPMVPSQQPSRGVLTIFRRPSDRELLLDRLEDAHAHARAAAERPRPRAVRVLPGPNAAGSQLRPAGRGTPDPAAGTRTAIDLARAQKSRASRLTPAELPCACSLTTKSGHIVHLLNVSTTGVLFESPLKFSANEETWLYLLAPESSVKLPSRFVRSEVATVGAGGVKYRTAAAFSREVDVVGSLTSHAAKPGATLRTITDLLVRVTTLCSARGDYTGARAAFEEGLRAVVPGCDIRLRDDLVEPDDGRDSVYFAVPAPSGGIMQVIFDKDHAPTAEAFLLLKAASTAATVIVQLQSIDRGRRSA
jgi:hypothetical protein